MRFRLAVLVALTCCGAARPARAQLHKVFPWFHRAEPAVERLVFVSRPELRIEGRRIGILPFSVAQRGEPVPPAFAPFVRQALAQLGTAAALVEVPDPLLSIPEAERTGLRDEQRIVIALGRSKADGVDLMAAGKIDALFRTASGGMVIKISAQLWDVEAGQPVWSGRFTVDWIRRYSLEDCLLRAAIILVEEWERAAAG